jgi:tRNA G18 (ribose-2'-O)-methylase SpoU
VPFRHEYSLETILDELAQQGFHIAALSPAGMGSITRLPKTGRRALLVGSEGHGLPEHILNTLSTWSIPMSDTFDSLNVATASAIALFHSSRFSG